MHATIKLTGILDKILTEAVDEGIAKTKTEALRLAVLELNNRYDLLGRMREDELAVKKMQKMDKKGQFLSLSQVKKKYPDVF